MGEKGIDPVGSVGMVGGLTHGGHSAGSLGLGAAISSSSVTGSIPQSSGTTPPPPPPAEGPSTGETVVDVVETVLDPVGSIIKKLF